MMAYRLLGNCLKLNGNLFRFSVAGKRKIQSNYERSIMLSVVDIRRSYCTIEPANEEITKFTDEHFDRLRKDIGKNGFINHKFLEKVIMGTTPKDVTDENAFLLITSCGHLLPWTPYSEKLNLFRKAWDQLQADTKLTRDHYLSALEVFRVNKFPLIEYQTMLKGISFELDAEIYEGLVGLACEHGDMEKATEIIGEMKERGYSMMEGVFNSLILGYSRANDIKNCENIVATMVAANMEPSRKTHTELIKAYSENGLPEKAIEILKEHERELQVTDLVDIIKTAALNKYSDVVKQAINLLPTDMLTVMEVPEKLRTVCSELVYGGYADEAFLIVSLLPNPKFSENQDIDKFGVSLMHDYIRTHQSPSNTIDMCKRLIEMGKNSRALHVATEIALRRNPDTGLEFLKALGEIEELRPHYFWPLIPHKANKQGEVGVVHVLKEMTNLNVEVDYETMSLYVFPRLVVTCKDVKNTIVTLENVGLKSSQILTPLIAHLLVQQRFQDIDWIMRTYQSKIDTTMLVKPLINVAPNIRASKNSKHFAKIVALMQTKSINPKVDLCGEVLLELIGNSQKATDSGIIFTLINEFQLAGVKLSSEAGETLKSFLNKSNKGDDSLEGMVNKELNLRPSDKLTIHPRDMSLDDLEYHLIELENNGMNTRGVLRRLLQLAVREGKYDRAEEIHKKCLDLKVQRSPGMIASVFEMHVKLGNIVEATNTIQELKKSYPGFQIDEHKIIDYATLLIRNGKTKDAKAILKQRANSTKIIGGEYVNKNVWNLLNASAHHAAQTDPKNNRNQTRDMLEYLNSLGYCEFSNVNLGTIIREYLLKKQIFEAIGEFRRITSEYRKTPLQLELMNELVRLSSIPGNDHYQSLLQDVVREATKIHGALSTNIHLILAIAESGTQNQLRKLLIDPQFKFNEDTLLRNCEHLSSTGKINVLLKLARASRGLGHVINEQDLYNILLNSFVRENNYASAIELFDKLEADDDFKISHEFVRSLVDLLKRNNLEIPSNVALRAQLRA